MNPDGVHSDICSKSKQQRSRKHWLNTETNITKRNNPQNNSFGLTTYLKTVWPLHSSQNIIFQSRDIFILQVASSYNSSSGNHDL